MRDGFLSLSFYYSSASYSAWLLRFFGPSLRIGILMPCCAKHLLSGVDSMTPGNFLAEYTTNGSEKLVARTGHFPVETTALAPDPLPTSHMLSLSLWLLVIVNVV
jgi:hypothetical protein